MSLIIFNYKKEEEYLDEISPLISIDDLPIVPLTSMSIDFETVKGDLNKLDSLEKFRSLLEDKQVLAAKRMLDEGELPLKARAPDGSTPLHYVVQFNALILIDRFSDVVNVANYEGQTPLHLAVTQKNHLAIQELVKIGADVLKEGFNRKSSLKLMMEEWESLLFPFLDASMLEPFFQQIFCYMPLDWRVDYAYHLMKLGQEEIVLDFIQKEDLQKDDLGTGENTLMHGAASTGSLSVLKALFPFPVDIKNERGETPLLMACQSGHIDIIEWLIEKGADINRTSEPRIYQPLSQLITFHPETIPDFIPLAKEKGVLLNGEALIYHYATLSEQERGQLDVDGSIWKAIRHKIVAHAWGLSGQEAIGLLSCDYEAFYYILAIEAVLPVFKQFLSLDDSYQHLEPCMDDLFNARHLSVDQVAQKICAKEPVLLPVNSYHHTMYLLFCDGWIYKCNRGLGTHNHGIEIYQMLTADMETVKAAIQKLRDLEGTEPVSTYFHHQIQDDLSLAPHYTVVHKSQTVGNCTIASLKTALHALFIADAFRQGVDSENAYKMAKDAYKSFTHFFRLKVLEEHFLDLSPTLLQKLLVKLQDPDRLKNIFTDSEIRPRLIQLLQPLVS